MPILYLASVRAAGFCRQNGHAKAAVLMMRPKELRLYQPERQAAIEALETAVAAASGIEGCGVEGREVEGVGGTFGLAAGDEVLEVEIREVGLRMSLPLRVSGVLMGGKSWI